MAKFTATGMPVIPTTNDLTIMWFAPPAMIARKINAKIDVVKLHPAQIKGKTVPGVQIPVILSKLAPHEIYEAVSFHLTDEKLLDTARYMAQNNKIAFAVYGFLCAGEYIKFLEGSTGDKVNELCKIAPGFVQAIRNHGAKSAPPQIEDYIPSDLSVRVESLETALEECRQRLRQHELVANNMVEALAKTFIYDSKGKDVLANQSHVVSDMLLLKGDIMSVTDIKTFFSTMKSGKKPMHRAKGALSIDKVTATSIDPIPVTKSEDMPAKDSKPIIKEVIKEVFVDRVVHVKADNAEIDQKARALLAESRAGLQTMEAIQVNESFSRLSAFAKKVAKQKLTMAIYTEFEYSVRDYDELTLKSFYLEAKTFVKQLIYSQPKKL